MSKQKQNNHRNIYELSGSDMELTHTAFPLLAQPVQQWVTKQGWQYLRRIQSLSTLAMLEDNYRNLLISAGTASGKTEAAFMPAVSMIYEMENNNRCKGNDRVSMLYVAPLKALINDQYRRLCEMSSQMSLPVTIWHGDAPMSGKKRMLREHRGVIMITPESLESFLMNRGKWCAKYMLPQIIILDEFHAFIGTPRGKQLLSLLHRIDFLCDNASVPRPRRIGLSATLSQLDTVASVLSGRGSSDDVAIIDGRDTGNEEDVIRVVTFPSAPPRKEGQQHTETDYAAMSRYIVENSVNEKTLTFARSRKNVEDIASLINEVCITGNLNMEAFPHHGSLSKETRETLEHRLVSTDKPTMAVATVTLELGIDIGNIHRVFQVNSTNTVASLRQRMGRSGRRDGVKRIDCLVGLDDGGDGGVFGELTTTIAEIELMKRGWFEPPNVTRRDVSVLISEILSVLEQYGNAYNDELYDLLCNQRNGDGNVSPDGIGTFSNVDEVLFGMVITDMIASDYLMRDAADMLMISAAGEEQISDWHFYATFQFDETYSVNAGGKHIGDITPPSSMLQELLRGGCFLLGGKTWRVTSMDISTKKIEVEPSTSRGEFLVPISRGNGNVAGKVRRYQISLLTGDNSGLVPDYLDELGIEALINIREYARQHRLNGLGVMISPGGDVNSHESPSEHRARCSKGYTETQEVVYKPPVDPAVNNAITKMLCYAGLEDTSGSQGIPLWRLADLVDACVANAGKLEEKREEFIDPAMLSDLRNQEKFNGILSDETLRYAYRDELFDVRGAIVWMEAFQRFYDRVLRGDFQ